MKFLVVCVLLVCFIWLVRFKVDIKCCYCGQKICEDFGG